MRTVVLHLRMLSAYSSLGIISIPEESLILMHPDCMYTYIIIRLRSQSTPLCRQSCSASDGDFDGFSSVEQATSREHKNVKGHLRTACKL